MVFEVLARQTGINFVLDKDVKSDSKTTIFVQEVPIEEAIDLVLDQNSLARQILSSNMVLIYPNTPAKQKDYEEQIVHTFYFTALAVVVPLILGLVAALIFHREFPFRGLLRGIFTMPMMATPVAVALVWTMMFHPQQGVLNYLLSLVGLPPSLWVYSPTLVIPSLVLVEIWHWTPLVMLIVLGGLAALPTEPYESARLDGATEWQLFRFITLPLIAPFLIVAAVIRTIDAIKAFDTIYVISQGGPGTASETINLYLYLQAFAFYNVGNASAVVASFRATASNTARDSSGAKSDTARMPAFTPIVKVSASAQTIA